MSVPKINIYYKCNNFNRLRYLMKKRAYWLIGRYWGGLTSILMINISKIELRKERNLKENVKSC
jgi:hypothetical protein